MSNLSTARIGDLLQRSEETFQLQPDVQYRRIAVELWGKGVVLRGIMTGAEVAPSRQMMARRGQFILSRIDARNGALGIVPAELDEAIVTIDFPVFNIVENRLSPAYLGWMCRTASFVDGARRERTRPEQFLQIELPMPDVEQQRRGEAIFAQLEAATCLQTETIPEMETLLPAILDRAFRGEL